MTGNTIECDKRFEPGTDINVYVLLRKEGEKSFRINTNL